MVAPRASALMIVAASLGLAETEVLGVEPVYISIIMHNEEPNGGYHPNFVAEPAVFAQHRAALLAFAEMLYAEGVMFNWQSDWNFLRAVQLYDNEPPSTNNKNIVRYLKEDLGFEVDPHAHETTYNYADVAALIELLGVTPSNTVGGMVVFPPVQSIVERLWLPITGWKFPGYTWQAEILWGGGTEDHQDEEPL